MEIFLNRPMYGGGSQSLACGGLHIGVVNIMPDSALEATERQFVSLLQAASGSVPVRVSFYTLPEVRRSEAGRRRVSSYIEITDLWNANLDGLIVTGTEPLAKKLTDEPCWPRLRELVDWADNNTRSSVWSCLSAQVAVLHMDGIHRCPLEGKRFGIFDCRPNKDCDLTRGLPAHMPIPHSRWNEIPADILGSHGYDILTISERAGVDMFAKHRKSLLVCFQGHPEYAADTLLREYRRDIRRFLKGENKIYPAMPEAYFTEETSSRLMAFRERVLAGAKEEIMLAEFPPDIAAPAGPSWQESAVQIYRNWLASISEQKAHPSRTGVAFQESSISR
jgi:homoserine O-succinyltransferase